ncbi:ferredoxin reductase-like protein [Athelia psychrophila]|uniref:Ferredoxin reductase-like protein n=1 Tax=Athelia psychrophila TaxID=1759441 RepID=A0A166AZC4_9AGAM|nr:ferredoxin reductase-like protein [Fibularhizoctonia sp. CBS 109695]
MISWAGAATLFIADYLIIQKESPDELEVLSPSQFRPLPLTSSVDSGPDTKLLTLTVPPHMRPALLAQNSIWSVYVKDDDIQVERPYTPLEGIDENGQMKFWIKKYPKGEVGRWLHSKKPGENIEVRGPLQTWAWEQGVWDEVVMISGGTGITPFYQLLHKTIGAAGDDSSLATKFTLLHSSRVPAELPPPSILDPLKSLAESKPKNFKLHLFVDSREGPTDGSSELNVGQITKSAIVKALGTKKIKPDAKIMFIVCGPDPMLSAIAGPYGRNFSQGDVGGALKELGCTSTQVRKL